MKNYSFSNIAAQESYLTRKSNDFPTHHNHRHSELKTIETNSRIQEIKKKYDTPSRRQRIQSLKKSRDFVGQRITSNDYSKQNYLQSKENNFVMKDSYSNYQAAPNFGGNHLKESFAVNRLQKSTLKRDINSKELDCIRNNDLKQYRAKIDKENNLKPFKSQSLEQEEIFISKVRQMKESIINNDYMRGSINPRSSISSANYSQMIDCTDDKRQFDPRVQNIDKINAKIKQILSCLAQSQKNPSKFLKDNSTYSNERQATICVNKVQNTRGSYLNAERPRISSDSSKHLSFFSKSGKQVEISSYNTKEDLKNIESVEIKLKSGEGSSSYLKYDEKKSWMVSNPNKSTFEAKEVQKDIPSFNLMSNEVERKEKQYRDYSVNKIDSYVPKRANYHRDQRDQDLAKTPSYVQNKRGEPRSALATSQSRSQIDSIRKSTLTDNQKSDFLKSGKKLNDQISKIQKKIEQFEAQKKKLNIQFTPFSMKNRSSSNLAAGIRFQNHTPDKFEQKKRSENKLPVPNFRSEYTQKESKFAYQRNRVSESVISRGNEYNEDNSKNQISFGDQSQAIIQESKVDQKMENADVKTFRIDKGTDDKKKNVQNQSSNLPKISADYSFDEAALRKRTDEGIQQRKKRLQTTDQIIKTDSLKKLIALFCQQAKLDQNFRNLKIWLQYNFSKDKYTTISKILSKQGLNLSQQQCQSLFRVEQSQNNPFFTSQGFDGSFQAVCKAYTQSKIHWQSKVKNKFDRQNLTSEGFTTKKIDLERKGFIELEDIVRLLNIQSGTFYRNRDIFLIFRRFTKGEKVNFEDILKQICI